MHRINEFSLFLTVFKSTKKGDLDRIGPLFVNGSSKRSVKELFIFLSVANAYMKAWEWRKDFIRHLKRKIKPWNGVCPVEWKHGGFDKFPMHHRQKQNTL